MSEAGSEEVRCYPKTILRVCAGGQSVIPWWHEHSPNERVFELHRR